jgi:aryl-alcohol dehydrogenase-like predicted oxidoreductase
METRQFGKTGHNSTVAIFGAYALSQATREDADAVMKDVMAAGVNHIDVAPSYGNAEVCLGPWMARHRDRFFLGCKTMERTKARVTEEFNRSLQRLNTDYLDLYGIHSVNSFERLEQVTGDGGPLEAILEARDAGKVRFIGITGHVPATLVRALERFDFDSITFPYNLIQAADADYRKTVMELLQKCSERNTGVMIIKSIAKGEWGDQPPTRNTWYEPFSDAETIQQAVDFVLSQNVTGICTAGDSILLPLVLEACQNFSRLSETEQEVLIASAKAYEPLFVSRLAPQ